MLKLNSKEVAGLLTLITTFVDEPSLNFRTFSELVEVFERRHKDLTLANDPSNDLRIIKFEKKMKTGDWIEPIILIRDKRLNIITDGIHKGIAYLRCINNGISERNLPEVYVIDNFIAFG